MRLALTSDLHANPVALEAVLADIGREPVDQIICLVAVAGTESRPRPTLARLQSLGGRNSTKPSTGG